MNARIKLQDRLTEKQKADITEYAKAIAQKENGDNARRFLKIVCVALNEKYSFGHDRLAILMDEINQLAEKQKEDCVFWSHIDRIVIQQLKLPFIEEDYDKMGE